MTDPPTHLTRVTVSLTPKAVTAMEELMDKTRLGKTDVINRALQIYALINELTKGCGALTVVNAAGEHEKFYIL
jgi:hypothetical protein